MALQKASAPFHEKIFVGQPPQRTWQRIHVAIRLDGARCMPVDMA
ncbi:hypothetical protein [Bremerella sp.]